MTERERQRTIFIGIVFRRLSCESFTNRRKDRQSKREREKRKLTFLGIFIVMKMNICKMIISV